MVIFLKPKADTARQLGDNGLNKVKIQIEHEISLTVYWKRAKLLHSFVRGVFVQSGFSRGFRERVQLTCLIESDAWHQMERPRV